VSQAEENTARKKLEYIRNSLKPRGHKVSFQDPFVSTIEGIISRGDSRLGAIIEEAFLRGCRLDAWDEYLKKDVWRELLEEHSITAAEILRGNDRTEKLPWDVINSGTGNAYLIKEAEKSDQCLATGPCDENCDHRCGLCPERGRVISVAGDAVPEVIENQRAVESAAEGTLAELPVPTTADSSAIPPKAEAGPYRASGSRDPITRRILFSFAKQGRAVWLPHLSIIEVFSMAALRAGIPVLYTQGFNPLPRIDFASPISIGISAGGEIATADMEDDFPAAEFIRGLNQNLPQGLSITEALAVTIPSGAKKQSVPALLWGYAYEPPGSCGPSETAPEFVKAKEEKQYRQNRIAAGESLFDMARNITLAKKPGDPESPESYFTVYRELYGE
jgi:radical SAM-linked protein